VRLASLGAGVRAPAGRAWPATPSKAQQSKRLRAAGAPPSEMLFVLLVRAGLWMGLTRARDLIIDSAPILAWRRTDPDAAVDHAPAHHPRPLLLGYRVHTLLCRGTGLPLLFRLSTAQVHDAPFARYWNWPSASWASSRGSSASMPVSGGSN
jgi:hypothetical protein